MTFDLYAELARVTNAYNAAHGLPVTPPMVPLMEFLDADGFFVRQNDYVPLTKREVPESIRGERQDCDETNDDRYNDPRHGQAKFINERR